MYCISFPSKDSKPYDSSWIRHQRRARDSFARGIKSMNFLTRLTIGNCLHHTTTSDAARHLNNLYWVLAQLRNITHLLLNTSKHIKVITSSDARAVPVIRFSSPLQFESRIKHFDRMKVSMLTARTLFMYSFRYILSIFSKIFKDAYINPFLYYKVQQNHY